MFTQESIDKELRAIQASIPRMLLDMATFEVDATPDLRKVVEKAIKDPEFPEDKRKGLQAMYDLGTFTKKRVIENLSVIKQIDQYTSRKIKESVKAGRLPNKKQLKAIKEQYEKDKKNNS